MVFGFGSSTSRLGRWEAAASRIGLFKVAQGGAWVAGVCVVLMGLITFFTVVLRRTPFGGGWMIGGLEIVQLLMAMVSVFALAFTWYLGGHIRIGLIREKIKNPRIKGLIDAPAALFGLVWIGFLAWGLWGVSMYNMQQKAFTTMLGIPESPWMFAFLIVMVHFFFVFLRSFLGLIAKASGRPIEHDGLY
ncbi:TRAP transporter small permease [Chloroflexota bacterium]